MRFAVESLQQRIKERNQWNEANSPLFKDDKFLNTMEEVYKQEFLQDISSHAEILVYDWSSGGDPELVVEDIERISKWCRRQPISIAVRSWHL